MSIENSKRRQFFWIILAVACGTYLLSFRPIVALIAYGTFDDANYLNWAARFVGETFPLPEGTSASFMPGSALAWLPAALIAKLCHVIFQADFLLALVILVGTLNYLYWVFSFVVVLRIFQNVESGLIKKYSKHLWLLSLLFIHTVPVLYYSTHRGTLVHSPELFFSLLLIRAVQEQRLNLAGCTSTLLGLLRLNDIFGMVVVFFASRRKENKTSSFKLGLVIGSVFVLLFGLLLWFAFIKGYNHLALPELLRHLAGRNGQYFIKRSEELFFGGDWGLFWTAPWWLFIAFVGLFRVKVLSWVSRACLAWMFSVLFLCFVWIGNGSDFGYRYLIGSYAAALYVWLELIGTFRRPQAFFRGSVAILSLNALWVFWLGWIYKEAAAFTPVVNSKGFWIFPHLQVNSFDALFIFPNYFLPLRHSPVAAVYVTWAQPQSDLAFKMGMADPRFGLTLFLIVLALVGIVTSIAFLVRRK